MIKHIRRPTTALMSVYTGVATERERELVHQYIEELERGRGDLTAALAAATARAEAAEAKLAEVDKYGNYCRWAVLPVSFARWLEQREQQAAANQAQQGEAQP